MKCYSILFTVANFGAFANAIPTVIYPLNSQVPPVIRLYEPFSYTFSNSTFSSDFPITYALSTGPDWLSLDSRTRTFSGIPTVNDINTGPVTAVDVEISASDQSGSTTLSSTFVISRDPAPTVSIPLSSQLPIFGAFSAPASLLLHPSTSFEFSFQPDTFSVSSSDSNLKYYATSSGNTPLPSWVDFDDTTLSFSGRTPSYESLTQPPQTFGIQIIASDVEGFAGSSISFEIEVRAHILSFSTWDSNISVTAGAEVNFSGLLGDLKLDGEPADKSKLTSITAQTPTWLSFNNSTLILSGDAPDDTTICNISVQVADVYGDTAATTVYMDVGTTVTSTTQQHLPKRFIIAIVVSIVLLFLLLAILLTFFCCPRWRRAGSRLLRCRPKSSSSTSLKEISGTVGLTNATPVNHFDRLRRGSFNYSRVDASDAAIAGNAGGMTITDPEDPVGRTRTASNASHASESELWETIISRNSSHACLEDAPSNGGESLRIILRDPNLIASSADEQTRHLSNCPGEGYGPSFERSSQDSQEIPIYNQLTTGSSLYSERDYSLSSPLDYQAASSGSPKGQETTMAGRSAHEPRSINTPKQYTIAILPGEDFYCDFGRQKSVLVSSSRHKAKHNKRDQEWNDGQGLVIKPPTVSGMNKQNCQPNSRGAAGVANTSNVEDVALNSPRESHHESAIPLAPTDVHIPNSNPDHRPPSRRHRTLPFFCTSRPTSSAKAVPPPDESTDTLRPTTSRSLVNNIDWSSLEGSFQAVCEGTKQLKVYIQDQLGRPRTRGNAESGELEDGRFEPGSESAPSVYQFRDSLVPSQAAGGEGGSAEDRHEHLHDNASEYSWETYHTSR